MEAAGIEPASCFDTQPETAGPILRLQSTMNLVCRAAWARMYSGRSNWLDLSSIDADLLSVVLAWEKISGPVRKRICALVHAAVPTQRDEA